MPAASRDLPSFGSSDLSSFPWLISFDDGVEDDDDFAHDRGNGDFVGLGPSLEALVYGLHGFVVSHGDHGNHEEDLSDLGPSRVDVPWLVGKGGVIVEGREAGEGGDFAFREAAELGHEGQESCDGDGPDALKAVEQPCLVGKLLVASDDLLDLGRDSFDFGLEQLAGAFQALFDRSGKCLKPRITNLIKMQQFLHVIKNLKWKYKDECNEE